MRIGMDFGTTNSGVAFYDGKRINVLALDPAANSSTIRSTPCVAGCDGPMFRTIFSPASSPGSPLGEEAGSLNALRASATRAPESLNSMSWLSAI